MSRPLRIEYPGALYHVTSRGNRREAIFEDDEDRNHFLYLLGEIYLRFHWKIEAYCLMNNHYHLLVETMDANLSRGMRQLNGVYTQWFNRRHQKVGHVFQGRFKAILVQKESYFLELARYVVLNPVRASAAVNVEDWPWSSYHATIGSTPAPDWMNVDGLLAHFGPDRKLAIVSYASFVSSESNQRDLWKRLRNQIILGDDDFIARLGKLGKTDGLSEIPLAERQTLAKSLSEYQVEYPNRDQAMAKAYLSGAYTMKQIASFFSVHYMTVSRAVRKLKMLECET